MSRLFGMRPFRGISFRISVTSWLVTLLALALYLAVNLPQQKRDLQEALRSKAQGVSSSLQDVTAGAAFSEDYSTVVEHCIQVLKGDDAIDYLVITKTDGYSVVVFRDGWRIETLDEFWRPKDRTVISEIAHVPLVGKTVFRYSRPFDYSALHWGWINVGLSTEAYDRSVSQVYRRSAVLAILSAILSLAISLAQARRLVQPIVTLQGVVGEVAQGDFTARASLDSGDEIQELANSFNTMADTILDRNRILESVRFAGQQLLSTDDWTTVVDGVLRSLGEAAAVSRAYVFENTATENGSTVSQQLYEWLAPGVPSTQAQWQHFEWDRSAVADWVPRLRRGEMIAARRPHEVEPHIDGRIQLVLVTPIRVGDEWWGLLGIDQYAGNRELTEAERNSFQAVADMLGAAIARQRAKQALVEANESLEQRVRERTAELERQVEARDEANRQLAAAQQRLMEMSRHAGMAEVATGVLHNVGNVLNSVNVSATIVATKIQESRLSHLVQLSEMLRAHAEDLPAFLTSDPKGKRIPDYLMRLGDHLNSERQIILQELDLLTGHIGHIKEIVATQQSYAKVSGVTEIIPITDLVEDAIRIVKPGLDRHGIGLEREYEQTPPASIDKHSVLQILLNLLRNSKQALDDKHRDPDKSRKRIRIVIQRHGEDRVRIMVADNGVGIPAENLTRIFSHGFTTRRDGHGFGLHSGANAARQMGGSLWAESEGAGQGASFTLELPVNRKEAVTPNARMAKETEAHALASQ
jgi:two-component system, NtrC family, sensor kinase